MESKNWNIWSNNFFNAKKFFESKGNGETKSKLKDKWFKEFGSGISQLLVEERKRWVKEVRMKELDIKDRFYGKSEVEWGFENAYNTAVRKLNKKLNFLEGKEDKKNG